MKEIEKVCKKILIKYVIYYHYVELNSIVSLGLSSLLW